MGVDSFFHPKIGGGGSFCLLSIYQAGFHSPLLPESSTAPQGQKGIESGQKVAKVNIYFLAFVFSRENRRPKTAKVKYILGLGLSWCCFHPLLWWRWWRPPSADGALLLPLFGCVPSLCPAFCPLVCFACSALHLNMALFRVLRGFLAGFGVRMYVCMGLALCVDCGAFVRVYS